MKNVFILILLILVSSAAFAQKSRRTEKKTDAAKSAAPQTTRLPVDPTVETEQLENAIISATPSLRVVNLKQFLADFPNSGQKARALESLVGARAALGDEKLQANETAEGLALFRLAVDEAPNPIPDRLFNEVISKFPANLFFRGQQATALEIAALIEKKAAGKKGQLLNLATFYLGIENGTGAKRLAETVIQIDSNSAAAYQTLGLAHRLNFELEESARAYSKALELDPESSSSKRSLAEMKRALGKPEEGIALYREILARYESDIPARTGLILSLFSAGKKAEAESEMAKSFEQNPNNLNLLAGAAYWYAASEEGERAVQLAQKAVELEPRFIWSHIALARGLLSQKKPVDAERVLVMARRYGNFPTLEYEIASARMDAGFYREAVEELQKSFTLKDGLIKTKLGGRVAREDKTFADLIAFERRASIFEPSVADNPEIAAKLKLLFEMTQKLASAESNEAEILLLTDEFVKGDDKMKLHRQLYAASILLEKRIALEKASELVKAAVGNADSGLDVASPAAAVMASELYESRTIAFSRNEVILVPDLPRPTLSAILRGRIEELSGWTLYQQNSFPEAVIRLRRAISVLPDKSAWWRSSMWRLGQALEALGKYEQALDSYIQSYKTDKPDVLKYVIVETLYKKVNGSTDDLEAKIGANPLPAFVASEPAKTPDNVVKAIHTAEPKVEPVTTSETTPKSAQVAEPIAEKAIETPAETKTQVVETPVNAGETAERNFERVIPQTSTEITTPAPETNIKASVPVDPPIEDVTPTEPKSQINTRVIETLLQTGKPAKKEIEDAAIPKKTPETITPAPDVPLKATEITEPAIENAPPADTKPQPEPQIPETPAQDPPKTGSDEKPADESDVEEPEPVEPPETVSTHEETAKAQPAIEPPKEPTAELGESPSIAVNTPERTRQKQTELLQAELKTADAPKKLGLDVRFPERQPAKKLVVITTDPIVEAKKVKAPKRLFEPVIIPVPRSPESELADDRVVLSATRVRIVDGLEIKSNKWCSIRASQENISLLNDGGSVGILVRIEGDGDIKDILASSSSPNDVELKLEPEVSGAPESRFYIVKSVGRAIGVYKINFESECGKKEVIVRVR